MEGLTILTNHIFAAETGAKSAGGIAALGVDAKALVLQIVTFVIVFLILKKFAFHKIIAALAQRQETINKGVELGEEMERRKKRFDEEAAKIMHKAREEADRVISAGHQEAGALLKQAEADGARKIDALLADAHAKIEDETRRARVQLEGEVAVLVAEATERIIGEKLSAEKDASLIKRAIQGVRGV